MKKSKFSNEQIAYALREVESGRPPADVCRQFGVSEATFYISKKKHVHLGVTELRRPRPLEDENARVKRLVAGRAARLLDSNQLRLHGSLGHLTPDEYARQRCSRRPLKSL